jgi:hypothetical protein
MPVRRALQQAFAPTKAAAVSEFDDDSVNAQITKRVQVHEQTAISSMIRGFRKAGMYLDVATWLFKIRIGEQTLREDPGFKEVRDRNVLLDDLSKCQQMQQFGIINIRTSRGSSYSNVAIAGDRG